MIIEFPPAQIRNVGEADAMPEHARLTPLIALVIALALSLGLWAAIWAAIWALAGMAFG